MIWQNPSTYAADRPNKQSIYTVSLSVPHGTVSWGTDGMYKRAILPHHRYTTQLQYTVYTVPSYVHALVGIDRPHYIAEVALLRIVLKSLKWSFISSQICWLQPTRCGLRNWVHSRGACTYLVTIFIAKGGCALVCQPQYGNHLKWVGTVYNSMLL